MIDFRPKNFFFIIFLASEKFDSDSKLDAKMHKTERITCDKMGNVKNSLLPSQENTEFRSDISIRWTCWDHCCNDLIFLEICDLVFLKHADSKLNMSVKVAEK